MRKQSRYGKWLAVCALLATMIVSPVFAAEPGPDVAPARVIRMQAAAVHTALGRVPNVDLRLRQVTAEQALDVAVAADEISLPAWGYRFRKPQLQCRLQANDVDWHCGGQMSATDLGRARFDLRLSEQQTRIDLRRQSTRLRLQMPADNTSTDGKPIQFSAHAMPLAWLQPALTTLWPEARFSAGHVDVDVSYRDALSAQVVANVSANQAGFDTRDGHIAAVGLGIDGRLNLTLGEERTHLDWRGRLQGGEWLVDPLYVAMPSHEVDFDLKAQLDEQTITIESLRWNDSDALRLDAHAVIHPQATPALAALTVDAASTDLAVTTPRYFESALAAAGLDGMALDGGLIVSAALSDGLPERVDLEARSVSAEDAAGRFALADLDGELHWRHRGVSDPARLGFAAASVYGLNLGTAQLHTRSDNGELQLAAPVALDFLGGKLGLDQLTWTPAVVTASTASFELGLHVQQVELTQLCQALAWPAFTGTLSGRLPKARYANGVLRFDGGLDMAVFDGRVRIDELAMERPFGVAPSLSANIGIAGLDLLPLTQTFGFGEISGRLDGQINDLRLINFAPVAFDAELHTSTTAADKRRISQRAVNELSSVGGGGIAAGLQAKVLKVFDTFGYKQIGLSCRLENNICHMGGLNSASGGYTIVEGSGLPRISVIGHQQQVDWPVLLARLQSVAEGQGPQVH